MTTYTGPEKKHSGVLLPLTKGQPIDPTTGEIQLFRTPYNYDRKAISEKTGTACPEPTRAQQHFKDECDINMIMKRFGVTGELPTKVRPVLPAEYDEVTDFASAMNAVRRASEAFMQMPSGVRARFQNNPQVFTEFFAHEHNREEAIRMGLIIPPPKKAPGEPKVPVETTAPGDKKGVT